MSSIDRLCRTIILISIFGTFSLTPFLFTASTSELFELPKMISIYLFATLVTTSWIVLMLSHGRIILSLSPFTLPLLILLFVAIAATLDSTDPHMSLYGYYSRFHSGFFALLSYAIIALAAATFLTRRSRLALLATIIGTTGMIALWGIASHYGFDLSCLLIRGDPLQHCWAANFNPRDRIFSTFGQANWLAGYLVMVFPFVLAFLLSIRSRTKKAFLAVLLVVFVLALLFTKSRGGYTGLALSLFVFTFFSHRRIFLFLVGVTAIGALLSLSALTTRMDTILIRLSVWSGAWTIFTQYPLLGTGLETFAISFDRIRPLIHLQTPEWDFLYNKAHNEWLHILATTGLLGFGSYVLFVGTASRRIWKQIPASDFREKLLSIAILSSIAAYLSQSFFGFSVVSQGVLFFTLPFLAMYSESPETLSSIPRTFHNGKRMKIWIKRVLAIIVLILGVAICGKIFLIFHADQVYAGAKAAAANGNVQKSLAGYEKAVRLHPDEPTYLDDLAFAAAVAARHARDPKDQERWRNKALAAWEQAIFISPNNPELWKTGMQVFTQLSELNKDYLLDALAAGRRAQELSKSDPKLTMALARLYLSKGNPGEARLLARQAQEMKPDYMESSLFLAEINQKLY